MGFGRDPIIWLSVILAVGCEAYVLFAGDYLPYIDWANHLGLISAMVQGSTDYFEISYAPTPYASFYFVTAALGHFVPVDIAAKVWMCIAAGACTLGAAELAFVNGRDPRLGVLAPLAMFGYAMGFGFASFVFATPVALFTLARFERLLDARESMLWPALIFSGCWLLLLCTHGMFFIVVSLSLAVRALVFCAQRRALNPSKIGFVGLSALPSMAVGFWCLFGLKGSGASETLPSADDPTRQWSFTGIGDRFSKLGSDLLDRGSPEHYETMILAAAFLGVCAFLAAVTATRWQSRLRSDQRSGLWVHAVVFSLIWLAGPDSLAWPVVVWIFYRRFAPMAALLILLLPKANLHHRAGYLALSLAAAALCSNAVYQRKHVEELSEQARPYDKVRELIPAGARVLGLTSAAPNDLSRKHGVLSGLFFYHLVDGAKYTNSLFDNPLHPVRPKKANRPRAPHWRTPWKFSPATHGQDYDYLVLRGVHVLRHMRRARDFRRVADVEGWHVFKNLNPPPAR